MDGNLLLCELHAHTTWSDGVLTVTELVDLYGRHDFDVLCITDHALRSDFPGHRLQPHTYPHSLVLRELAAARRLVDRYELFNRQQTFGWVAEAGLPGVASGDFHRPELKTWKTLLPCAKNEAAVIEHLRSSRRAYVVPWGLRDELRKPLAA